MTKDDLEYFRMLLEKKRLSIMRDLGLIQAQSMRTTSADSSGGLIYSDHMPDLGSDAIEREKAFLFASRDGIYLSQVEDALKRIEDASFGICRVCGKPIPKERLEAVPTTTICVPCKEAAHRQQHKIA